MDRNQSAIPSYYVDSRRQQLRRGFGTSELNKPRNIIVPVPVVCFFCRQVITLRYLTYTGLVQCCDASALSAYCRRAFSSLDHIQDNSRDSQLGQLGVTGRSTSGVAMVILFTTRDWE